MEVHNQYICTTWCIIFMEAWSTDVNTLTEVRCRGSTLVRIYNTQYGDCATIGKLSITVESHISEVDLSRKWRRYGSFWPSHSERFACCALTMQYIICSTVGRSITSISNLGEHIYLGTLCLGKYDVSVMYQLWTSLPYYTYYILLWVCNSHFFQSSLLTNMGLACNA